MARMKLEQAGEESFECQITRKMRKESAEFPSVTAVVAKDESGHRFISRPRLQLIVGAIALATAPTLGVQKMGGGEEIIASRGKCLTFWGRININASMILTLNNDVAVPPCVAI